jgi:hypothetical protein
LIGITTAYTRAEAETRAPNARLELPKSFWPTTTARP